LKKEGTIIFLFQIQKVHFKFQKVGKVQFLFQIKADHRQTLIVRRS